MDPLIKQSFKNVNSDIKLKVTKRKVVYAAFMTLLVIQLIGLVAYAGHLESSGATGWYYVIAYILAILLLVGEIVYGISVFEEYDKLRKDEGYYG